MALAALKKHLVYQSLPVSGSQEHLRSWLDCSLSGNLPLDLTAMGDPTRSVAPDGIALGITGPRKPLHHDKVAILGEDNKSLAQTQFIRLVSVNVFTAPWHNQSKRLYKRRSISLKSYQRCNCTFKHMFSMQSANGCAFICVYNLMGAKWNGLNLKLCVFCLPSSPSAAHHAHLFSIFF